METATAASLGSDTVLEMPNGTAARAHELRPTRAQHCAAPMQAEGRLRTTGRQAQEGRAADRSVCVCEKFGSGVRLPVACLHQKY